ncbi:MAG: DNA mismatch repair protein [Acidobacteriota bacterium]
MTAAPQPKSEAPPLPDLLSLEGGPGVDRDLLSEILELAFLGSEKAADLDRAMGDTGLPESRWDGRLFADDLFLADFVRESLTLAFDGHRYRVNERFLRRVLANPPTDLAAVEFRQQILGELVARPQLAEKARQLYRQLIVLVSMFKAPNSGARLDTVLFRLDILKQLRRLVGAMVDDFAEAQSGLRRLHEAGRATRASREFRILEALLDHHDRAARLRIDVDFGADGKIRDLRVAELLEDTANRFHHGFARRLWLRLKMALRGYRPDRVEILKRLVLRVYQDIAPALRPIVQVAGHLEVYLTALQFAESARQRGLEVCLPAMGGDALRLSGLFNPLLLARGETPTPNHLQAATATTTLITGPNSGGKTRLLQAVGLAQILAQSGLFVPAAEAQMPLVDGLFASLLHNAAADQSEGRLGTELVRIRTLFESVGSRSLVILDELCSGTNPSEAEDIIAMVLELLEELAPLALISSHFLDFVRRLEAAPPVPGLTFLQAEIDAADRPTYQFLSGVATSSLAAQTARRLGVTSEKLAALVQDQRTAKVPSEDSPCSAKPPAS